MKDFLGQELNLDDEVVYCHNGFGRNYTLERGKVTGFTPAYVYLLKPRYNSSKTSKLHEARVSPRKIIKLHESQIESE